MFWFIEDDVYIPNKDMLLKINQEYPNVDLISPELFEMVENDQWIHWDDAIGYFDKQWYRGLQCIACLSNTLLSRVNEFVNKHKTLRFIELFFPTLAIKNNLKVVKSPDFKNLTCYQIYNNINDLNPSEFYHPIKDTNNHLKLRELLNK